jgi:dephospho-CoA kinase
MLIPLQRMEVYGLTGGIGSGKSTVASLLEEYGVPVVSADELSRIVVAPGSEGLRQVIEEFGADMVDEAGELDRGKMASLVFRNPDKRRRLEEILHPRIRERFEQVLDALEKAGHEVAIYEVPLLFEKNLQGEMKAVILVTAPDHVRVTRVRNRDDVTETEVRARMAAQLDEASKRRRADYVIENDGNLDDLRREVEFVLARFLRVGVGPRAPADGEPAGPLVLDDGDPAVVPLATPAPSRRTTEVPTGAAHEGAMPAGPRGIPMQPEEVAVRTGSTLPPGVVSSTASPPPAITPTFTLPPMPGTPSDTRESAESNAATMPLGARLPPPPPEPSDIAEPDLSASRPTVVSVHEPPSAPPLRKPDAAKTDGTRPATPRAATPSRRTSTLAAPTLGAPTPPPLPSRPSTVSRPGPTPPPGATQPSPSVPPPPAVGAPTPPRGQTERVATVQDGETPPPPTPDAKAREDG